MPEASQPVAGRWSGSDTTGKIPPQFEHPGGMPAGLFARSRLPEVSFGERFFGRKRRLHPCRGALGGRNKTGGVAHAQPPATRWDASGIPFECNYLFFLPSHAGIPPASNSDTPICVFAFARWICANGYALTPTQVRSPRSATARPGENSEACENQSQGSVNESGCSTHGLFHARVVHRAGCPWSGWFEDAGGIPACSRSVERQRHHR